MKEAIDALNRDTILRENGGVTSSDSMVHFCELIIEHSKNAPKEVLRNRLEWVSCYEDLPEDLKGRVESMKQELDHQLSNPIEMTSEKAL